MQQQIKFTLKSRVLTREENFALKDAGLQLDWDVDIPELKSTVDAHSFFPNLDRHIQDLTWTVTSIKRFLNGDTVIVEVGLTGTK